MINTIKIMETKRDGIQKQIDRPRQDTFTSTCVKVGIICGLGVERSGIFEALIRKKLKEVLGDDFFNRIIITKRGGVVSGNGNIDIGGVQAALKKKRLSYHEASFCGHISLMAAQNNSSKFDLIIYLGNNTSSVIENIKKTFEQEIIHKFFDNPNAKIVPLHKRRVFPRFWKRRYVFYDQLWPWQKRKIIKIYHQLIEDMESRAVEITQKILDVLDERTEEDK